jgi:hypothetical protein
MHRTAGRVFGTLSEFVQTLFQFNPYLSRSDQLQKGIKLHPDTGERLVARMLGFPLFHDYCQDKYGMETILLFRSFVAITRLS